MSYAPAVIKEYSAKGYWTKDTLSDYWDLNAEKYPNEEAIVDSRGRLTWSQSKQWIDRLAFGLIELGIQRDETIVIQLPPSVEQFLLRIACEKAGILGVMAARTLKHCEMEYIVNKAKPAALVIPWKFGGFDHFQMYQEILPNIAPIRHCLIYGDGAPEGTISLSRIVEQPLEKKHSSSELKRRTFASTETSLVVHTTGTTGMPKLVELAACSHLWRAKDWMQKLKLTKKDILGMFMPAASGPNTPMYFGSPEVAAKVVIQEKFAAADALKLIEKERVTFGVFIPTMLLMMIKEPGFDRFDLSSLRFVQTGGAPLPYEAGVEVGQKLRCPVLQAYGGVDHDICTMHALEDSFEVRHSTVGKPIANSEIKLVDAGGNDVVTKDREGELWGRGPSCPPGFYKDPEGTRAAWGTGWYNTEDLGKWDEYGNLALVGRKRDIVIRGGQNIYPGEVEELLRANPKIADCAIVKMPDAIMGEKCCAYIVPKAGETITFEEIIEFLKAKKLALYKLPERVEYINRIPRIEGQFKVNKKDLEQDIIEKLQAESKS